LTSGVRIRRLDATLTSFSAAASAGAAPHDAVV